MNIPQTQIDALRIFGYTEEEARFLCLVATHSGYFVARQFLGFTGARWGKRATRFCNKLRARQHARTYRLAQGGTVHHLFSRRIYRQIGHENLHNCREHELDYIHAHIAMLDFVLGHLDLRYLATEPGKVSYFSTELGIAAHHLPSKAFSGRHTVEPAIRYFVDCYPMFHPASSSEPRVVTFTYLQGAETNLVRFAHHLRMYLPLFRELPEFRFLFLAREDAHFAKACELFHDLVAIPLQPNPAEDLLRYFAIRKAWDLGNYTSLTEEDLIFRNLAKERFRGTRFERFYHAWKVARLGDAAIRDGLRGSDKPHSVHFEARLLKAIGPADSTSGEKQ